MRWSLAEFVEISELNESQLVAARHGGFVRGEFALELHNDNLLEGLGGISQHTSCR